jgi:cytoskeletal protein CcmA (bactofilin family)
MFTNNKNEEMNKTESTTAVNMIGSGTCITGDIKSKGDIRVDGTLNGSVETEGKVVLGKEGVIEGDVTCVSADVSGTIKAKITVSQLLSLKATAKLNGDIVTNKLSIEPGATFTGSCSMGAVIKDIKHVEKTEKAEKSA